jgi:hypothetical protein
MKPTLYDLSPEERDALLAFAAQHGRYWKKALLDGWLVARYPGPLQRIRNSFGPVWLDQLRLPNEARKEQP